MTIRRISPSLVAALPALLLFAAACGVSRTSSEDVLAEETTESSQAQSATDGSSDGTGDPSDDEGTTPTTVAPEPTPTPTTAPADEVAFAVDFGEETFELTHGELNEVVIPTWENQEFVTRAFGGSVPPGFYENAANEFLIGKILDRELIALGGTVSAADSDQARNALLGIMQSWYPEAPDPTAAVEILYDQVPYLSFVVKLQATQSAISTALATSGSLDIEAPCVRHILVDDEVTAQEVLGLLDGGADFATLAAEYSTGPTGPNGGDLGCSPSAGYVPEFAAAVDAATVGEFVGPVQTQFGWHVLVVERYEATQMDPGQIMNTRIVSVLESLTIDVDPRLGVWNADTLSIVAGETD